MSCAYAQCRSNRRNPQCVNLSNFTFPRKKERAVQWAINCGRTDLLDLISKQTSRLNYRLCSLHFERPNFLNDRRNCLTQFAIPTIFLSEEETDKARLLNYASYIATKAASNCETVPMQPEQLNTNSKPHCAIEKTMDIQNAAEKHKKQDIISSTNKQSDTLAKPKIAHSPSLTNTSMVNLETSPSSTKIGLPVPQEAVELNGNKKQLQGKTVGQTVVLDSTLSSKVLFYDGNDLPRQFVTVITTDRWTQSMDAASNDLSNRSPDIPEGMNRDDVEQIHCRLCAKVCSSSEMLHIFGKSRASVQCLRKIRRLLPSREQPFENDHLPHWVCRACGNILIYCDQVIRNFVSASVKLKNMFSNTEKYQGLHEVRSTSASNLQTTVGIEESTEGTFTKEQFEENFVNLPSHNFTSQEQRNPVRVQQEMQVSNTPVPLEFEDDSNTDSFIRDEVQRPVKMKAHHLTSQIKSVSNPQLIKMDSGGQVTSLSRSEEVMPSQKRDFGFIKTPPPKRRRKVKVLEYQGKKIQNSHINIPTSSDNETPLCPKCDLTFDSIEAALTHRFKEHAAEEILSARSKIDVESSQVMQNLDNTTESIGLSLIHK